MTFLVLQGGHFLLFKPEEGLIILSRRIGFLFTSTTSKRVEPTWDKPFYSTEESNPAPLFLQRLDVQPFPLPIPIPSLKQ